MNNKEMKKRRQVAVNGSSRITLALVYCNWLSLSLSLPISKTRRQKTIALTKRRRALREIAVSTRWRELSLLTFHWVLRESASMQQQQRSGRQALTRFFSLSCFLCLCPMVNLKEQKKRLAIILLFQFIYNIKEFRSFYYSIFKALEQAPCYSQIIT